MTQNDFYSLKIVASVKRQLINAGFAKDQIQTKLGAWCRSGSRRWREKSYFVQVAYCEANDHTRLEETESKWNDFARKNWLCPVKVEYFARD